MKRETPSRDLTFEWGRTAPYDLSKLCDSIDTKIMGTFATSSLIIGVTSSLHGRLRGYMRGCSPLGRDGPNTLTFHHELRLIHYYGASVHQVDSTEALSVEVEISQGVSPLEIRVV